MGYVDNNKRGVTSRSGGADETKAPPVLGDEARSAVRAGLSGAGRHARQAVALALIAAMVASPQLALAAEATGTPATELATTDVVSGGDEATGAVDEADVAATTDAAVVADEADGVPTSDAATDDDAAITGVAPTDQAAPNADASALSGTCGAAGQEASVTWALTQNNDDAANPTYTLTISGNGAMADFHAGTNDDSTTPLEDDRPWAAYASQVTEVRIEEGVESLGDCAFYGMTSLERANIPASIKKLGNNLFSGDTSLTTVTWAAGFVAPSDTNDSGVHTSDAADPVYTGTYLPRGMFDGCTSLGEGVRLTDWLPSGFTGACTAALRGTAFDFDTSDWGTLSYVGPYAFASMRNLTGTVIVNKAWKLGLRYDNNTVSGAFRDTGVTSVVFEPGVTDVPKVMFQDCASLRSVDFGSTVTYVGEFAFDGTSALESVDLSGVKEIDMYAFRGAGLAGSLVIPSSVDTIGTRAFEGASALTSVIFQTKSLSSISNLVFSGCTSLQEVTVAKDAIVQKLDSSLFAKDASGGSYEAAPVQRLNLDGFVKTLSLKDTQTIREVKADGANTLSYSTLPKSLETLTVTGDAWQIPSAAFVNWTAGTTTPLKTLIVTAGTVTDAGSNAFRGTGLERVSFTGKVKLGNQAFAKCPNLVVLDMSQADVQSLGGNLLGESGTQGFGIYVKDEAARTTGFKGNIPNTALLLVTNGGTVDLNAKPGFAAVSKDGQQAVWYKWNSTGSESQKTDAVVTGVNQYGVKWSTSSAAVDGDLTFDDLTYGYGSAVSKQLTVTGGTPTAVASSSTAFDVKIENGAVVVTPTTGLVAGAYEATVAVTTDDGSVHNVTATLTVKKATIVNAAVNGEVVYVNGGRLVDAGSLFALGAGAGAPTYKIVDDGNGVAELNGRVIRVKKAGTIKVEMATAASANYEAAESVEATLVVRPGTVRSAGVHASVAYVDGLTYDAAKLFVLDKNAGVATYTVSGPAKLGADGHTIEVTGTGIVTVTANTAASADGNWAAGAVEAELTVSDGSLVSGVTVAPYVGTYDGTPHDAVKVEAPADATVSYALNDGTWETVAPQLTDAGEYTVKVRVERANFEAYETTVTASIAKAAVDMSGVTFADATVTYDGTEHALEVAGELPEGVTGVSYENNTLTHAGATRATATFSVDANHEAPAPLTATLTVARAAQQIAADKAELSLKTGERAQVKLSGVADGAAVTWASSDPEVATVAADGTVTALKAGTATLAAGASATGDFEASNAVEVKLTVTDTSADGPDDTGNTGNDADKKGDDKKLPQAGDASLVAPAVAGTSGILAVLGGLLARKKRS